MGKVVIIQEVMKHYRVSFYQALYENLRTNGIELEVIYSDPSVKHSSKKDNVDLPVNYGGVKVSAISFFNNKVVYQKCFNRIASADLVIVEQANKHLVNYWLMVLHLFKYKRFAFWGHGRNFQSSPNTIQEKIKKLLITQPHWWFAYTSKVVDYVECCGFPKNKITNVCNSVDTLELSNNFSECTISKLTQFKRDLKFPIDSQLGLYCGAMYEEKKIDFLLIALLRIKESNPNFHFIFCGAGPDQYMVEDFCRKYSWAKYLGAVFDVEKALCFKISDIVLNPGLVGLGILDCFVAGVPMITTDYPKHSPEISYLKSDDNGVMVEEDIHCYTQAVLEILDDKEKLKRLSKGALASSKQFSIEDMASNFANGIEQALVAAI